MYLDICGVAEAERRGRRANQVVSLLSYEDKVPRFPNMRHLVLYMDDVTNDSGKPSPQYWQIKLALDFIRDFPNPSEQRLLVHCHMGISRSTALALGASFLVKGILSSPSFDEALNAVLVRAPD